MSCPTCRAVVSLILDGMCHSWIFDTFMPRNKDAFSFREFRVRNILIFIIFSFIFCLNHNLSWRDGYNLHLILEYFSKFNNPTFRPIIMWGYRSPDRGNPRPSARPPINTSWNFWPTYLTQEDMCNVNHLVTECLMQNFRTLGQPLLSSTGSISQRWWNIISCTNCWTLYLSYITEI